MKQTPLYDVHVSAGATMVDFAGWNMPVSYVGTVSEVQVVRTKAGLFDVSHMGEFRIVGPDAFDMVQSITSNDVSRLHIGESQYSLLLTDDAGVVDDIIVYRHADDGFLIVVNAGCLDKDWAWFESHAGDYPDCALVNESDLTSLIALQGPDAIRIGLTVLGAEYAELQRFQFALGRFLEAPITVSRTGYTGEDGFEIFCDNRIAVQLWNALAAEGAVPAGLGARDVLRLEAAYPLYGHELDSEHTPWESGTGWAVKLGKGDFNGRAAADKKRKGNGNKLVGITMNTKAIPREHCTVYNSRADSEVGTVTSGTFSPTLQQGIAMARLSIEYSAPGTEVVVDIRGRKLSATVVKLPFYRNGV